MVRHDHLERNTLHPIETLISILSLNPYRNRSKSAKIDTSGLTQHGQQ